MPKHRYTLKLLATLLVTGLLVGLIPLVSAQGDGEANPEDYPETFPVAVVITGIVDEVTADTVTIDQVLYWLSDDVDPTIFVVGEPVTVTVVLAGDVTMTVIGSGDLTGEVDENLDPAVTHPVGTAIAEAMQVPYEEVMGWSAQNLGFGEIARAYLLAYELGLRGEDVTVMDILSLRLDAGANWGDIMHGYGVHPSLLAPGRIMSGRFRLDDDLLAMLPDDVLPDGTLTSVDVNAWGPQITEDETPDEGDDGDTADDGDTIERRPGDHGCPRPGNYCNAPGWRRVFGGDDDGEDD